MWNLQTLQNIMQEFINTLFHKHNKEVKAKQQNWKICYGI